jgi:uncharacterized damage-inducible protein DinB
MGERAAKVFAANERTNQLLIASVDAAAWRAEAEGNVRTIAAIFAHMHNVRTKWVRLSAPEIAVPGLMGRAACTQKQASAALGKSAKSCEKMLAAALDGSGRVKKFKRDGWGSAWPAGVEMLCYMIAHEAHHRGQVCMLAHQVGYPVGNKVTSAMWNWEKIWRDSGWGGIGK